MKLCFKLWLENSEISINYNDFELKLKKQAEKQIEYAKDREYEANNFNFNQFISNINKEYANYPKLNNLLNAIHSKNIHYIFDQKNQLRKWLMDQPYKSSSRDLSRQIYIYIDTFSRSDINEIEKEMLKQIKAALENTVVNMNALKQNIENAISRIANWSGSKIIIEPYAHTNEYDQVSVEPTESAEITFNGGQFSPSFVIFKYEGKFEIDDVLEAGDEDFFHSVQIQSDYFNLINELKKPGSTNKGKVLTLYTARPKKDREQFLNTKTLPLNIFLTNDYDHAEGISRDLADSQQRDVWKVRIDSRYLTKTLDGKIQYFQVTTPNTPVVSMVLL